LLNRYSSETPNVAEPGFPAATHSKKIRKLSQKEISKNRDTSGIRDRHGELHTGTRD
jgi:hypothetical protein